MEMRVVGLQLHDVARTTTSPATRSPFASGRRVVVARELADLPESTASLIRLNALLKDASVTFVGSSPFASITMRARRPSR